jgi:hypothetical protein
VKTPIKYIPEPTVKEEPMDWITLAIAQVQIEVAKALSQQNVKKHIIPIPAVRRGPIIVTSLPVTILKGNAMTGLMQ